MALDSKYARVLACENFLLDAHLNMRELAHELFDTQDTGYVSLVRINESLAAFGQKELSAEDEAQILKLYTSHRFFLFEFLSGAQPFQILQNQRTSRRMPLKVGKVRSGFMVLRYLTLELYTSHSELNEVGEMEWWRLADILQYSVMNCLLNVCVRARENNGDALGENSSLLSVLQPHEIPARRLNGAVRSQRFAAVCVCVCVLLCIFCVGLVYRLVQKFRD